MTRFRAGAARRWAFPLAAGVLATSSACERVVDVDVPEGPVRLVVDGRIELVKGGNDGRQRVRLTATTLFGDEREPPAATGATVTVSDGSGRTVAFTESSAEPGVYETMALPGVLGERYTLRIDWRGERYQATDVLAAVPAIDSIYFQFEPASIFAGDSGFRAAIDYTDPAGERNFYLWEQLIDGKPAILPDPGNRFRVIGNDDFYDGRAIKAYQPFDEAVVEPGQEVLVRQVALRESSYRFYFALFEQATGNQGSPFSVPAAGVRGNVANLTDPAHYPLGYFLAVEVAEARATLPRP
jgi:hypothetical protein